MWIVWYMCTVYMCVHVCTCVCAHICIMCIVHAWRVWHKIMIYFRYKLYCGSAPLRPTRRGWHLWFLPPGFPVNITSGLVQEQLVVPNLEVPSEARFQGIRESLPKKCCLMRPYTHATILSVWDLKPPLIGDGITVSPCLGWRWRRSLGMEGEIDTGSWEESEIPNYHQQAVPSGELT